MIFFSPSERFLEWLAKYARGRFVFDVGCGDGHMLRRLHLWNVKALGIEPFWDEDRECYASCCNAVLPQKAQECRLLKTTPDSLVLFCRPCHGGWVAETISLLPRTAEVLYISKPCNVLVDLPDFKVRRLKTPKCHEERVYRVERHAGKRKETRHRTHDSLRY